MQSTAQQQKDRRGRHPESCSCSRPACVKKRQAAEVAKVDPVTKVDPVAKVDPVNKVDPAATPGGGQAGPLMKTGKSSGFLLLVLLTLLISLAVGGAVLQARRKTLAFQQMRPVT